MEKKTKKHKFSSTKLVLKDPVPADIKIAQEAVLKPITQKNTKTKKK